MKTSPLLFVIIGIIIGVLGCGYCTIHAFRDRVNSIIVGAIWGKKGRKSKSPKATRPRSEKTEVCVVCGKASPISEMDEANIDGSKGRLWIHPHCHGE